MNLALPKRGGGMGITFTALCHRLVGRGAFNHGDCNEDMSWVAVALGGC